MREYAYLLGLYLGDGCLGAMPRTWSLRIYQDARYPGIIEEARAAVAAVSPTGRSNVQVRRDGCVCIYGYSKQWPELFPRMVEPPERVAFIPPRHQCDLLLTRAAA